MNFWLAGGQLASNHGLFIIGFVTEIVVGNVDQFSVVLKLFVTLLKRLFLYWAANVTSGLFLSRHLKK